MYPIALIVIGLGINGQILFTENANDYTDYNTCLKAATRFDLLKKAVESGGLRVNGDEVVTLKISCQEKKS